MANGIYDHKSFYGFYPSEVFDFGDRAQKINQKEHNSRSISDLMELKDLYKASMPASLGKEDIICKCRFSKQILNLSIEDIDFFSESNQRIAGELVPLISLFISVMAMCISIFGTERFSIPFIAFGIFAIIGTCQTYLKSAKLKDANCKIKEMYRTMIMCFETLEEAVKE